MPWREPSLFDALDQPTVAVPYASGSETSKAGAVHALPTAGSQSARILELIQTRGPLSDHDLRTLTGYSINIVTARRNALAKQRLIVKAGTKIGPTGTVPNVIWQIEPGGDRRALTEE